MNRLLKHIGLWVGTTFFMSALIASAHAGPGHNGPGFNCNYATKAAEHAVCSSRHLSKLDRKLNYWFAKAMQRASYFDQTYWLRSKQSQWLHARNACGWNQRCLTRKYKKRIRALRNYYTHV